jgi:hypothetical protein
MAHLRYHKHIMLKSEFCIVLEEYANIHIYIHTESAAWANTKIDVHVTRALPLVCFRWEVGILMLI